MGKAMSMEAEQALIGCILVNNKAFELVSEVEPHHFRHESHKAIYNAMYRDLIKGNATDSITVLQTLRNQNLDEDVGGLGYLTQLMTSACHPKNAQRYAEILTETYRKEQLKALAFDVIGQVEDGSESTAIVGHLAKGIDSLHQNRADVQSIGEALTSHITLMEHRISGKDVFFPTGLTDLDRKLGGGFSPGDLVILAARPSMGKTAMSLTMALNVAQHKHVMFFSMEMSTLQLMDRAISNVGNINFNWVRNPSEDGPEWAAYTQATMRIDSLKLHIDDKPARTLMQVQTIAKAQHRKTPLGMVFVDYLGLMRGGDSKNRNLELGEYTKGLKELAKLLKCPVVALAQLNRGVEQRANKRPLLSDLRDSGEIEADADVVMFLYRDEYYNKDTTDKGVCEVDIAKQRQGETGFVGVAFRGEYQRFDDLAYQYQRKEKPVKENARGLD